MRLSVRIGAAVTAALVAVATLAACAGPATAPRSSSAGHTKTVAPSPSSSPADPPWSTVAVTGAPQRVRAAGAALADAGTEQLMWSRGLDTERPIGSITKVMTALVVIRAGGLNREIRIPKAVLAYVAKYQGESAGLHPGDRLTVLQLLNAMLLPSGCDAAWVLAMTYGPGMPAFLAKMNATARQLGMMHTEFTSPDGLPYPTEYSTYSTPADLLRLGMAAMASPVFRSIVDQPFYHIAKGKGHHAYWWDNDNGLIGTYAGADGIKTGFTNAARHCLLFEATRNGTTLIGVALGSPVTGVDAAADAAAKMLNWGFSQKLPATS